VRQKELQKLQKYHEEVRSKKGYQAVTKDEMEVTKQLPKVTKKEADTHLKKNTHGFKRAE
jgi:hypothetical protein